MKDESQQQVPQYEWKHFNGIATIVEFANKENATIISICNDDRNNWWAVYTKLPPPSQPGKEDKLYKALQLLIETYPAKPNGDYRDLNFAKEIMSEYPQPSQPVQGKEDVSPIEVIKRAYAESQKLSFGDITEKEVQEGYLIANEMQDILGIYLEGDHKLWKESYSVEPQPHEQGKEEELFESVYKYANIDFGNLYTSLRDICKMCMVRHTEAALKSKPSEGWSDQDLREAWKASFLKGNLGVKFNEWLSSYKEQIKPTK